MYKTCPKCGHTRTDDDSSPKEVCPACGLIFKKYLKQQYRAPEAPELDWELEPETDSFWQRLQTSLMYVQEPVERLHFYGYCLLYMLFLIWGWQFIAMDYAYYQIGSRIDDPLPDIFQSFMHNINLVFHEAGHVLFRPFGYFMMMLGGSLFQLIVPLVVMLVFLFKEQQTFAASIGLWWLGQSLMDLAPYINDARNGQIILLGGTTGAESTGYHDWETVLGILGWMSYDHRIADAVDSFGILLMCLAFVWGFLLLRKHFQLLD